MKYIIQCRKGYVLEAPCNYLKDNICGEDMKPCVILRRWIK